MPFLLNFRLPLLGPWLIVLWSIWTISLDSVHGDHYWNIHYCLYRRHWNTSVDPKQSGPNPTSSKYSGDHRALNHLVLVKGNWLCPQWTTVTSWINHAVENSVLNCTMHSVLAGFAPCQATFIKMIDCVFKKRIGVHVRWQPPSQETLHLPILKILEKRKKMFFKEILCFNPSWPCEIFKIAVEYLKSSVRYNEIFMLR